MSSLNLRHCYLCHRFDPTPSSVDVSHENEESFQRFLILATRFLNLSQTCSKLTPEKTLSKDSRWVSRKNDLHFCNKCDGPIRSFCQMYDRWFYLQLEMNRCLEKVTTIFRECENLKMKNNEKSSSSVRDIGGETIDGQQDYSKVTNCRKLDELEFCLKQIEMIVGQTFPFPYIKLTRVESKLSPISAEETSFLCADSTINTSETIQPQHLEHEMDVYDTAEELLECDSLLEPEPEDEDSIVMEAEVESPTDGIDIAAKLSSDEQNENFTSSDNFEGKNNQIDGEKDITLSTPAATLGTSMECLLSGKCFNNPTSPETHERIHLSPQNDDNPQPTHSRLQNSRTAKTPRASRKISICLWCGKEFRNSGHFENHMRVHTKERPYECNTCGKSFAETSALQLHEKGHRKPYLCTECYKSFALRDVLVRHVALHHGPEVPNGESKKNKMFNAKIKTRLLTTDSAPRSRRVGKCLYCAREFPNSSHFENHMRVHTRERPYDCKLCEKSFAEPSTLQVHLKTHTKPHLCSECGKQFALKDSLLHHASVHHGSEVPGGKKFQCDQCEKCFVTNACLKEHMLQHLQEKPFQCAECPKGFTRKKNLAVHMRFHTTGEKPYKCGICNRGFESRGVRNLHERTVCGGVKAFTCKYCQRAFARPAERNKHEYVMHEKEKVPRSRRPKAASDDSEQLGQCRYCGKCFSTRRKLSYHERNHTRVRPKVFECETCLNRFQSKSHLQKHLRTHSKPKPVYKCKKCGESVSKKKDLTKHKCTQVIGALVVSHDSHEEETPNE